MRSVVVTLGPPLERPWWWNEIKRDSDLCPLDFRRVVFRNKTSRQIRTVELPLVLLTLLKEHLELRRRYDYVFTFECDLTTFAFAFWQTLLFQRRPRHVVLQFIMREKSASIASRTKYAFMKWCFSSLHRVVCSSRAEAEYYAEAFNWPQHKTAFVPFHTSESITPLHDTPDVPFVLAAGRTFRDYPTLLRAVEGSPHRVVIVAARESVDPGPRPTTIELLEDIPLTEFDRLVRTASVVVVPLNETHISTGQLVMLHAMAAGRPVIATRTSGTVDYITHGENGLLVPPHDPRALRSAIDLVMGDSELKASLGVAARRAVLERHLPHHYTRAVRNLLQQRGA